MMKQPMPCEWARGAWNRSLGLADLCCNGNQWKSMNGGLVVQEIQRSDAIWGHVESPAVVKKLGNRSSCVGLVLCLFQLYSQFGMRK